MRPKSKMYPEQIDIVAYLYSTYIYFFKLINVITKSPFSIFYIERKKKKESAIFGPHFCHMWETGLGHIWDMYNGPYMGQGSTMVWRQASPMV